MIKDIKLWEEFEKKVSNPKLNYEERLELFLEMHELAVKMSKITKENILDGLDEKVEFVRRMRGR